MRMKKCFTEIAAILLSVFFLTACGLNSTRPNEIVKDQKIIYLPSFHSFQSKGPFHLTVVFGSDKNKIKIEGVRRLLDKINVNCRNDGMLTLSTPFYFSTQEAASLQVTLFVSKKYLSEVKVEKTLTFDLSSNGKVTLDTLTVDSVAKASLSDHLRIKHFSVYGEGELEGCGNVQIDSLYHTGSGNVHLETIHSQKLSVTNVGSGKTTLYGAVENSLISQSGSGALELFWISNDKTAVTIMGNGKVIIAGRSGKIVANAEGSTHLDATYLNARTAFIQTCQTSTAYVNVRHYLFAHAVDRSQINYYREPEHLYRITEQAGVILPMF